MLNKIKIIVAYMKFSKQIKIHTNISYSENFAAMVDMVLRVPIILPLNSQFIGQPLKYCNI